MGCGCGGAKPDGGYWAVIDGARQTFSTQVDMRTAVAKAKHAGKAVTAQSAE